MVAVACLITAAGCGTPSSTPSPPALPNQPGLAPVGGLPQLPRDSAPVDACALLTSDEISEVIGTHEVQPQPLLAAGACTWRNPDTYVSVSLLIGRSGSAINGTLPEESDWGPTEPGPDGIRFAPGGITEFVIGDRACELQMVTDYSPDVADSIAVRLVGLVRGRL